MLWEEAFLYALVYRKTNGLFDIIEHIIYNDKQVVGSQRKYESNEIAE